MTKTQLMVMFITISIASCKPTDEGATIRIGGINEVKATFSDNSSVVGWDRYDSDTSNHIPSIKNLDVYTADVADTDDNISLDIRGGSTAKIFKLVNENKFAIGGKYYFRYSAESGWLGGCINANAPHLGFMISKQGEHEPIADFHIALWNPGGSNWCAAVYVTGTVGNGWCQKVCYSGPPSGGQLNADVKNMIGQALVDIGWVSVAAFTAARVAAPFIQGAMQTVAATGL